MSTNGPIYIAGLSYSGKTQLRLMLSGHPNIIITRRTYMWRRFYNQFGDLRDTENFKRCLAAMLASKHIQTLNPNPERIRQEFYQGAPEYGRLFTMLHQHYVTQLGKKRWGNQHKSIEEDVDLIFASDPNALIIHMVRHPFDRVEESVSQSAFRKGKIGLETTEWRKSSQNALRNQKKYPQRYLVLQCELLFSHPEKTLKGVCNFLGEEFSQEMLAVDGLMEMGVAVLGASKNQDLTTDRKQAYPSGLTPTERLFVHSRTNKEMSALGYSTKNQRLPFLNFLKYALVDFPIYFAGAAFWKTWGNKKFGSPSIILEYGS